MHLAREYLQVLCQHLSCLGFFLLFFLASFFHLIHWLYIIKSHGFGPFEVVATSPRKSLMECCMLQWLTYGWGWWWWYGDKIVSLWNFHMDPSFLMKPRRMLSQINLTIWQGPSSSIRLERRQTCLHARDTVKSQDFGNINYQSAA